MDQAGQGREPSPGGGHVPLGAKRQVVSKGEGASRPQAEAAGKLRTGSVSLIH